MFIHKNLFKINMFNSICLWFINAKNGSNFFIQRKTHKIYMNINNLLLLVYNLYKKKVNVTAGMSNLVDLHSIVVVVLPFFDMVLYYLPLHLNPLSWNWPFFLQWKIKKKPIKIESYYSFQYKNKQTIYP